jgi:hypothetical protein
VSRPGAGKVVVDRDALRLVPAGARGPALAMRLPGGAVTRVVPVDVPATPLGVGGQVRRFEVIAMVGGDRVVVAGPIGMADGDSFTLGSGAL